MNQTETQNISQQEASPLAKSDTRHKRWGMVIDQRRCIGCHSCTVACKSENNVPLGYWRSWVKGIQKGSFPDVSNMFLRRLCNQCDSPPCVQVCPVQATVRRPEDGIVVMFFGKCIGCGMCIAACPYDARFFNPIRHTADKCDFCATRIENGLNPACVDACLSGALIFGDIDDPSSEICRVLATTPTSVIKSELGTRPKVYYIQAEHSLQGRIWFSEDFEESIVDYKKSIPSPTASYWKNQE
ncbi:MAG: 4Fe-4S dicluster domain-containing protein [Desulfomonilaceae bacterium]